MISSVLYEPTCTEKAGKYISAGVQSLVQYTTPNLPELQQMHAVLSGDQSLVAQELNVHGKHVHNLKAPRLPYINDTRKCNA